MMTMTKFSIDEASLALLKLIFIEAVCDILSCDHYTGSKVKDMPEMKEVHYFVSTKKGDKREIWRVEDKDLEKRLAKIAKPLVEEF